VPDKAILFGINRYKQISDLRGCINDVRNVKSLLIDTFDFTPANIRTREDDAVTKSEIQEQWAWLLDDVSAGDRLVFHFSGHGSYTTDEDGDEDDGVDELLCLYPMDWSKPNSYLLDDDIREMTNEIPDGVRVTFLLDTCHSGTATRMVAPPESIGELSATSIPLIDVRSTFARLDPKEGAAAFGEESAARRFDLAFGPESVRDAQDTVVVRFAPPPAKIQRRWRKRGVRKPLLAMRDRGMNHTLLSGSRSDQTSADAYIDDDFHGAFSYYLCQAVQETGPKVEVQRLIKTVRAKLSEERFTQIPQLEPEDAQGILFGGAGPSGLPEEGADSGGLSGGAAANSTFGSLLQKIIDLLEQVPRSFRPSAATDSERHLVYVHGICRHDEGYSDNWWRALRPHLSPTLAEQLDENRHEVLWCEIVSPTRVFAGADRSLDGGETEVVAESIRAILEDRAERRVIEHVADQPRGGPPQPSRIAADRGALGIPGLNCVDDFVKYLLNDSIRDEVIDAFLSVVEPILRQGSALDIISHSWGTVVAYEGLRRLENSGLRGRVGTLFTVGSALSIGPVKRRLLWKDGARPGQVDQWVNLDARGDIVGGALDPDGFAVDVEYLGLHPTGCTSFLGLVSPACAHSSYFRNDNRSVNGGVFARQIEN